MHLVLIFHKLITARSPHMDLVLLYITLNNITNAQNQLTYIKRLSSKKTVLLVRKNDER